MVLPPEILLVEDAPGAAVPLERGLQRMGRRVVRLDGGRFAAPGRAPQYDRFEMEGPLPDNAVFIAQGYTGTARQIEAIERLRQIGHARLAVLVLVSPGDQTPSQICLAADDFALLPADAAEVCLRLETVRQRRRPEERESRAYSACVRLDEDAFVALVDDVPIDLTFTEFELFRALYMRRGNVVSREDLARAVWGHDQLNGSRVVDVHMWRLRTKLEAGRTRLIETIRNRGYRLLQPR